MILSQSAVYALRAAHCLAEAGDDNRMRIDDVAERLDLPRNYLSKILHTLARVGILESARGPGGGFKLARDPNTLPLEDVIRPFDDLPSSPRCLLGRTECLDSDPCAAHMHWKAVSRSVDGFFRDTTLADLSRDAHKSALDTVA